MYGDMKMMVFRKEYLYTGGQVNLASKLRRIHHADHVALGGK
jgi:hypothetical protein